MQLHEMKISLSIAQMREDWCVYLQWKILPDGTEEPWYLGVCKIIELFQHPDAHKNSHWRANTTDAMIIRTSLLMTSDKTQECWKYHTDARYFYKPICNVMGYQASGASVITCTQGPNMGKTYATQSDAARSNGVSQPTMSSHLNGKPGYGVIAGMRFKKGLL